MSVITQIGGADPNLPWILGSVPPPGAPPQPLAAPPGRTYPPPAMRKPIAVVDDGVRRTMARVGGGRGADLVGGLLLSTMVVGTAASLTWIVVDVADMIGGPVSLAVRAALIAAGLVIRATGDRILHAAEATDGPAARRWLEAVGGRTPPRLDAAGLDATCVAAVGEKTSSVIVAPLFWLVVGGPAAMWGWLAARSLREARLGPGASENLTIRVPVVLADLAEQIPAVLSWLFLTLGAGIVRLNPGRAGRAGWRSGRSHLRLPPVWGQETLAGALGIQIEGGRVFDARPGESHPRLGEPIGRTEATTVALAVRIMQVGVLVAAGASVLMTLLLSAGI